MAVNGHDPIRVRKSNGISGWVLFFATIFTILACSGVSWALTSALAAPKSEYASNINDLNNSIEHLQDTDNNLNSFISYETAANQTKIDDIGNDILGINSTLTATDTKITGLNTAINTTNSKVGTLTTTVSAISGLEIVPSITTTQRTLADGSVIIDGGTLNLAIRSTQTVDSRIVAFKVEFMLNDGSDMVADKLDETMQDLYTTKPVVLLQGGSSGVAVAPDHVAYNVYYQTDGYHLGSVVFTTQGTAITKSTTTKTLAYTFNAGSGYAFDVIVTPIFECASTTINTVAPVW